MFDYLFRQAKNLRLVRRKPNKVSALINAYQERVLTQQLQNDPAQLMVLNHLQQLLNFLSQHPRKTARFRRFADIHVGKSLYIFGEVGRGKSMMMEIFFQACPIEKKRRVHFSVFMLEVHDFIHHWRQQHHSDPIAAYAKHLRASTWLLCFDEFNVTDIADAMILTRLFKHLFAQGFLFVATSNYHPDDLYQNGLQRGLFLPFIQQLKQAASVLELAAQQDYRLARFKTTLQQRFYIGTGEAAEQFLRRSLALLIEHPDMNSVTLQVQSRAVYFKAAQADILFSSFAELCNRALGTGDYKAIANQFNVVFIAHIPQLSPENRDQARRFVNLIDALYEHNVKIVCTLAVAVNQLYRVDQVFEFKRTQSRLMEMQSDHYWQAKRVLPPLK